jgi:flagellar basal-body rod modification protein FlgD
METPALNALFQTPTGGRDPITNAKLAKKQLDQTDFLNLLMRQLQYQDPLKPMDNQEFTSQLTSFSSLNQLVDLNTKLDTLQSVQLATTQLQATSLIGKEVSVRGNLVHLGAEGTAKIPFQLAADAGRVTLHVLDKDGNVVRTIEAGELKVGEQTVAWDGKDDKGKAAPEGNYTIEVNAFDAQGKKVAVETMMRGIVSGVDLSGIEVSMTINGMQVPLSALLAVRTPPSVA